jgi:hypothetical protein
LRVVPDLGAGNLWVDMARIGTPPQETENTKLSCEALINILFTHSGKTTRSRTNLGLLFASFK